MKQKNQNLIQQLVSGALFLAVVVMLGWLSVRFSFKQDWTYNNRNTISEASQQQLASMDEPLRFVAFVYPGSPERTQVQYFFDKYRRFKPDAELVFVDPSSEPQKVKDYNITFAGELVVEYQGRRESLRQLSEQTLTTALQRLSHAGEQWVVFLEGHGERSVAGTDSQNDYNRFAEVLREKGLKVQALNLARTPAIPDNTSVLVIASPRSALLPGEIELVTAWARDGGNLLWLADPDHPAGLASLAETLGVRWQNGFAVFPEYELLGTGHPGIFVALDYPPGPVTRGLNEVTLFPLVRSVEALPDSGWNARPMLTTSEASWLEVTPLDGRSVVFDTKDGDLPGPLDIGMILTREVPRADAATDQSESEGEGEGEPAGAEAPDAAAGADDENANKPPAAPRTQRVALIGDADFLSDASLGQLGNQQLGLNLVQWLASRDAQLNIDVPSAPDTHLFLPAWATLLIGIGFVIVLPVLLIGTGVARWMIRRRR